MEQIESFMLNDNSDGNAGTSRQETSLRKEVCKGSRNRRVNEAFEQLQDQITELEEENKANIDLIQLAGRAINHIGDEVLTYCGDDPGAQEINNKFTSVYSQWSQRIIQIKEYAKLHSILYAPKEDFVPPEEFLKDLNKEKYEELRNKLFILETENPLLKKLEEVAVKYSMIQRNIWLDKED